MIPPTPARPTEFDVDIGGMDRNDSGGAWCRSHSVVEPVVRMRALLTNINPLHFEGSGGSEEVVFVHEKISECWLDHLRIMYVVI